MRIRIFTLMLLVPMLVCCNKTPKPETPDKPDDGQEQVDPDPDADLPPQVKDGDVVLATNPNVEKFVTTVTYPEKDYTFTHILDDEFQPTAPGKDDVPSKYTIRWEADASAGEPVVRLWEDDGWSREYTDPDVVEQRYVVISNLRPNTNYHFEVKGGSKVLTSGSFKTTGHVHQVIFSSVRNARDLGGWKTKDGGATVKYRKVYRGGRLQKSELRAPGRRDLKAEGIKAQLDLRGTSDVLSESPLQEYFPDDYAFCAPVIEEGYILLLRDDSEKARQCMQFIMKCVRENKPVYFHCSLGRDRTGTIAMLVLGILGVDEGVISKEYEITQFAPQGWATSTGEKTKMTRKNNADYWRAANYIWSFAGENGTFAQGAQAYLLSIGISQEEINEFRQNMLDGTVAPIPPVEGAEPEPEPEAPVKIDGDMTDWAGIEGISADGVYKALKATYDTKYFYLYSKRTWHDGLWTADGYGYYYYCLEVDGNAETGQKNPNGQHEFPYGIDSWFYCRPFLGSPTEPVFAASPKGQSYPTEYMANIVCNGAVDPVTKDIETEMRIPRTDLLIEKGQTVKIHSRGNKSADNIVDTPLTITIEN